MSVVNVDAQLMKNGSASLSRVDERLVEVSKLAREGRDDYLLVESRGNSEPLPAAEPRLGRRTALTFPLLPPPQKN
jgi:G3E family GTPase